ncbi:MAG: shikimate dehydrogenase [Colwellia sp.]|nr:shikimate dehydrogenase [Colwellia sp.]
MDKYRVFGNPIKQSRSPLIHQSFAESTQQQLNYQSEFVAIDGFKEKIKQFINEQGKGANITVPFKEQALAICDQLSERARLAGAVNTLSFVDGQIIGDNTDGLGLVQDLLRNNVNLKNSKILLLGAGGAAKGVVLPLLEQQPESIVIANRTVSKAEALCHQFTSSENQSKLRACGFENVENDNFDIIINATSASLSGSVPPISEKLIRPDVVCYDMVYGKEQTPFMNWAKKQGSAQVIDGLGMLVSQAAESFAIWRGVKPEVETVISYLRKSLASE